MARLGSFHEGNPNEHLAKSIISRFAFLSASLGLKVIIATFIIKSWNAVYDIFL